MTTEPELHTDERMASWDIMLHPDMDAMAKRDAFLSEENGKRLQEMIDQIHLMEEILGRFKAAE